MSSHTTTAGVLERGLAFFLFSMLFDLASLPLLGSFTTDIPSIASIAYPTLLFIWIFAALWARRHVKPKPVGEDDVLVRWGHPPRKGTVIAHCLYVASAAGNILLIIIALLAPKPVVTIGSATSLEGLSAILRPLTRWGTTIFAAIFAFIGILHARATYHEIKDFETAYSLAEEYAILEAAKKGHVVFGHEFSRVAQVSVASATTATTSVEPLPGEIVGRHLEKWVGQNGPFIVDLEKEPNQHILVFGPAGSGKTQTVWALVLRYWLAKRIPFLVLDSMGEYVGLVRAVGGVVWTVPTDSSECPRCRPGYLWWKALSSRGQLLLSVTLDHAHALSTEPSSSIAPIWGVDTRQLRSLLPARRRRSLPYSQAL